MAVYTIYTYIFTGQCCYYYHGVPNNVTMMSCNPEGSTIRWNCQVYSPHDPSTDLSVKWYRSTTEEIARERGEMISEMSGKYTFSTSRASLAVNDSQSLVDGLFLNVFVLTVDNFNSTVDDGYYWCQMVINDSCLEPSDFGHIALNPSVIKNCNFNSFDFIKFKMPQVCATESPSIAEVTATDKCTPTTGLKTTSPTDTTTSPSDAKTMSQTIILYAVIGVLAFIVVLLLLVIMVFTVYTVRNHMVYHKGNYKTGYKIV